jgi:hypothetical protein
MAKAIRNQSGFNKKNLVFLIRNISSKELHSALGKISVVNLMYRALWDLFYLADLSGNAAWL